MQVVEVIGPYLDHCTESAFRLETLQHYAGDDAAIDAYRQGLPRPERSVRTNAYLRRLARATLDGRQFSRVHVVDLPLSESVRVELTAYQESAAVGEVIGIAERQGPLHDLHTDFWLIDQDNGHAVVLVMSYNSAGVYRHSEVYTDTATVSKFATIRAVAEAHAIPLNAYLGSLGDRVRVA
jgi:hypothetical protein